MKSSVKGSGRGIIPYFLMLSLILSLGACRKKQVTVEIPQLVKVTRIGEDKGITSVTYPGKIEAASNVKLAFRVAGPIRKVYVNEGQYVKKGQLLADLDPRDYRIQFDATEAEYTQVTEESDRVMELYRRGSVSVNEYDKAVAAKKRVTALYNAHRNALNDTRLKAPFDGYIQKKYFSAPEIIGQGTPVLSMIDDDYFEVTVNIPAGDFIRRADFTSFEAIADIYPNRVFPLELLDITQGANYNQLFTARFRLKRDPGLAAGMSMSVKIGFKPDTADRTILPVSALFQKNGHSYVWVYDESQQTIRRVPVKIEYLTKNGEVIVRSNLRNGQTVVSAGVNELKEGQKVKPLPPVSASNVGGLL